MFIQDFIRIDAPLVSVVGRFEDQVLPRLDELVPRAWSGLASGVPENPVPVVVGSRRQRSDAVVYSVAWDSNRRGFPAFDADIEIGRVAPAKTLVEFAGQSRLPFVEPWSVEDQQSHGQTVAAVGLLLASIVREIQLAQVNPPADLGSGGVNL